MTDPIIGSSPPRLPPPANSDTSAAARLPALEPIFLALGYRLGELRLQVRTLASETKDCMIVPWTIVSDVFQRPSSLDTQAIVECQQRGAAWVRHFADLLDEIDTSLPRPASVPPSRQFLDAIRSVGTALREDGGFGARLLQQMLFHKDALPPLTAAVEATQGPG